VSVRLSAVTALMSPKRKASRYLIKSLLAADSACLLWGDARRYYDIYVHRIKEIGVQSRPLSEPSNSLRERCNRSEGE
jgi:hypothetical protein